jgi:hypothetical protein
VAGKAAEWGRYLLAASNVHWAAAPEQDAAVTSPAFAKKLV